ncbi:hypothetical protein D3C73_1543230 [compost metagenome]
MHNLPLPQELQAVLQVYVIGHVDQPLVCSPGLFFGGDVLVEVSQRIAFGLDIRCCPWHTR